MAEIIIFGYNENEYLGEGWNERSLVRGTITARTSSRTSSLIIPINSKMSQLLILASASVDIIKKPIYGFFKVNDNKVGEFKFENELWKLLKYNISPQSPGENPLKIEIVTENAFVVNDYLKNGDMRTFGIHISCIRLM